MFKYGYSVLVECIHEHKVCAEIKQKSNYVLFLMLSKVIAVSLNLLRRNL